MVRGGSGGASSESRSQSRGSSGALSARRRSGRNPFSTIIKPLSSSNTAGGKQKGEAFVSAAPAPASGPSKPYHVVQRSLDTAKLKLGNTPREGTDNNKPKKTVPAAAAAAAAPIHVPVDQSGDRSPVVAPSRGASVPDEELLLQASSSVSEQREPKPLQAQQKKPQIPVVEQGKLSTGSVVAQLSGLLRWRQSQSSASRIGGSSAESLGNKLPKRDRTPSDDLTPPAGLHASFQSVRTPTLQTQAPAPGERKFLRPGAISPVILPSASTSSSQGTGGPIRAAVSAFLQRSSFGGRSSGGVTGSGGWQSFVDKSTSSAGGNGNKKTSSSDRQGEEFEV